MERDVVILPSGAHQLLPRDECGIRYELSATGRQRFARRVIVRRLQKDPDFAVEYLKAALEDEDEPRVLLIALRHLAEAQGICQSGQGRWHRARESLPRTIGSRQPGAVHASRRHQSNWVETHRRSRFR